MDQFIMARANLFLITLIISIPLYQAHGETKPGDVYKEYTRTMGQTNRNWRVTDPNAKNSRAHAHLPNDLLDIVIDDLKGAIKAEAIIDRWGGHPGTSNKKIRFNGHDWIVLPELTTTPEAIDPENFVYQDNPVIPIPLVHLKEGLNQFEGTCDDPEKSWPQWGWDGILVRIYYDRDKPHPAGKILSPVSGSVLSENPVIQISASSPAGIDRIDVLACYDGFDENGDGIFKDWHHHYWCLRGDSSFDIRGHVGTAYNEPYRVTWDTEWVPDQKPGSIKILARIKDKTGIWFVTDAVTGLSLQRSAFKVAYFTSADVPPGFTIRNKGRKFCHIDSPEKDGFIAEKAILHLRTWNGDPRHHLPFRLNDWYHALQGNNHNYDYDVIEVPIEVLNAGMNKITFESETVHHGSEILWPGPVISVRYRKQ